MKKSKIEKSVLKEKIKGALLTSISSIAYIASLFILQSPWLLLGAPLVLFCVVYGIVIYSAAEEEVKASQLFEGETTIETKSAQASKTKAIEETAEVEEIAEIQETSETETEQLIEEEPKQEATQSEEEQEEQEEVAEEVVAEEETEQISEEQTEESEQQEQTEQTPRYSRTKVLHGYIQRRNKALEEDSQK